MTTSRRLQLGLYVISQVLVSIRRQRIATQRRYDHVNKIQSCCLLLTNLMHLQEDHAGEKIKRSKMKF